MPNSVLATISKICFIDALILFGTTKKIAENPDLLYSNFRMNKASILGFLSFYHPLLLSLQIGKTERSSLINVNRDWVSELAQSGFWLSSSEAELAHTSLFE